MNKAALKLDCVLSRLCCSSASVMNKVFLYSLSHCLGSDDCTQSGTEQTAAVRQQEFSPSCGDWVYLIFGVILLYICICVRVKFPLIPNTDIQAKFKFYRKKKCLMKELRNTNAPLGFGRYEVLKEMFAF